MFKVEVKNIVKKPAFLQYLQNGLVVTFDLSRLNIIRKEKHHKVVTIYY